MVFSNSVIEVGNICGGVLLFNIFLKLFENIFLGEKENNLCR